MADRQWFVNGIQLSESGTDEWFVNGAQLTEISQGTDSAAPVITTNINRRCQLQDNVKCKTLTGTIGQLDLSGRQLTSTSDIIISSGFQFFSEDWYRQRNARIIVNDGILSLNGTESRQLDIVSLNFTLASGVVPTASYCSVYDSIVTYEDSPIDATDDTNINAGGTNTGWLFVVETVSAALSSASIFISKLFKGWIR